MAADPRDLTTVASTKLVMQKSGANAAAQDALIQQEITRASVKIMRDYEREFVPGGPNSETFTNATRTFEFDVSDQRGREVFADLSPYDLQITPAPTVIVDSDTASPHTLTTDEYRLWPVPATRGVYEVLRLSLFSSRAGSIRWSHRQFTVQGNWGFPNIPEEVKQACDETVVHWITSYPAARRVDQVDSGVMAIQPRSYPMTAIDLLKSFKRIV